MRVRMLQGIEDSHEFLGDYKTVAGAGLPGVFARKGQVAGQDVIAHVVKIPAGVIVDDTQVPDLARRDWIDRDDVCEVIER